MAADTSSRADVRSETLLITDLVVDPGIQIRKSNTEATIQRYAEIVDALPPVEAVETPDGRFILYEGFQRTAAHLRAGRTHIRVQVRPGTRELALELAAIANLRHGQPLEPDERDEAVRRLHQLHPDLNARALAERMLHAVSYTSVQRLMDADEVRRAVMFRWTNLLSHAALSDIHGAPREAWAPLVRAYDANRWSRAQLQQVIAELADDATPQGHKEGLLRGTAQPGDHLRAKAVPKGTTSSPPAPFGAPSGTGSVLDSPDYEADYADQDWDEDEYVGDEPGYDPVGSDVGERLVAVSPLVIVPVRIPSDRPRQRGNRTYRRERMTVQRTFSISVSDDVLDGWGDPNDPDTKGWALLCREVYRQLWKGRPAMWPPTGADWGE